MLRANSEIAVAISVRLPFPKPASAPSRRPCWRADTTSYSAAIVIRTSSSAIESPCQPLREEIDAPSRSSAVGTSLSASPSCTIARATLGWMPTMTVSAPRRRNIAAVPRNVRVANESITSTAVTSITTPVERSLPTRSSRSSRSSSRSVSLSAACTEAIRKRPCLRIGTPIVGAYTSRESGPTDEALVSPW